MGIFKWLFGNNGSHNQAVRGNNNLQIQDNSIRFGGRSGCIYGGFPSLERCDGAFGSGCPYQWNCPAYHNYVDHLPSD